MKTVIVIPTYNEAENIKKLIKQIFSLEIADLEIVVVDDNSPDGTANLVYKLQSSDFNGPRLHMIKRQDKLGLGSAYIAGFKKALKLGADYIFEMDADFSHDPDDIPRLLKACESADLTIGSRKIKDGKVIGWGWIRKFMSNGAMWFSKMMLGLKTKDVTAGFRCFRRQVLESIEIDSIKSNGYAFQEELLHRTEKAGFRVMEIPVTFIDREEGKSKLSKKDILEFFWIILKLKLKK
ncbi:MAG: polyprenol monophosphomannose synthase [Candidatus Magasanikbacteria bacterium]|jgi:dolichol-phosphate mannosyltransferase|nr:polyprenol monophosphomannose synthase [Candidatus Magasanikbacteria bacterium]MBT4314908.1 polyprenol monophosphomannose synthase [Candidatus Magasanikbacteria bacterium]MBT4546864.1 polyprenol monophosphomannose synthase [Candidatus Magasanikbacteria bacterium]MBT6819222.1 polyprenol monophosphomannose synthase [Candidatus Magasanikbacteria bacterium]